MRLLLALVAFLSLVGLAGSAARVGGCARTFAVDELKIWNYAKADFRR